MSGHAGGRRGKKGGHEEDEHPDERWALSYMDMITVLMCMFLVLFAMSSVDQQKFIALKNSLATGFGQTKSQKVDTATGTVVRADQVSKKGPGYAVTKTDASHSAAADGSTKTASDTTASAAKAAADASTLSKADQAKAAAELADLQRIEAQIAANLAAQGTQASVGFSIDARGLTVRLVGSETYFGSNSADMSDRAKQIMNGISPVLATSGHDVSVEGHADARKTAPPFATNWELSSARATTVLRDLVERGGLPGDHIQAVGFGSSRPLSTGTTDADYANNRRVDIVVLSNQSEDISGFMGKLAALGVTPTADGTIPGAVEPVPTAAAADAAKSGSAKTDSAKTDSDGHTSNSTESGTSEKKAKTTTTTTKTDAEGAQSEGH